MSRAFVKEDVDEPEPSGRTRSGSGLPPGALNYITARGAQRLREQADGLRRSGDEAGAAECESILATTTVVRPPSEQSESVTFGATVTLRMADGEMREIRIVGVDELGFEPDSVSWVSPVGRALLGAEVGSRVALDGGPPTAKVVKIEHRSLSD